jgi:exonuclease SbcC
MKILRLELLNLNSLQGKNEVDFTQPPLANSGLFAITGPTGAGKSTILDAITLALYGRAARYGTTSNPENVMSRQTGECSAEVDFSCATGTFRSVWQLQRARRKPDGKIQQAKRRLIALPGGAIITESIKDTDARILELTGLDYDRFLRSVLLAQGDFAAFLKAGPKERTDLLQQVTGTFIYEDISRASYRRWTKAQQDHTILISTHAAVAVLTSEDRQRHEATLAEINQRLKTLGALVHDLTKRTTEAQTWLEIEAAGRQLSTEQNDHADATRAAAPALAQLARHEKASVFIADITSIARLGTDNAKDQTALQALEATLPALAEHLRLAEAAEQAARTTLTTDEGRITTLQLLWNEVTDLDKTLAAARETLRLTASQHAGLEQTVVDLTDSLARERSAQEASTKAHTAVTTWLSSHAGDADLAVHLPEIQAASSRWKASDESAVNAQKALSLRQEEVGHLQTLVRSFEGNLPPLEVTLTTQAAAVVAASSHLATIGEKLSLREIEGHRDQIHERRLALEALAADALRLRTERNKLAACIKEATDTDIVLGTSTTLVGNRKQQLDAAKKLLSAQRTALAFAEKVQSLEGHRTMLQSDAPCPLCGSAHHPYAVAGAQPSAELEAIRRDFDEAESATNHAQEAFNAADKRHGVLLGDQKRLASDQVKLQSAYTALFNAWTSAAAPFGLADQSDNESLQEAQLAVARAEETRRSQQVNAYREAELVLQKAKQDQQNVQTEIDRVNGEISKQKALVDQAQGQLPTLAATLENHRNTSLTEQKNFGQWVAPFGRVVTDLTEVPGVLVELKTRAASYATRQAESAKCATNLSALNSKCGALSEQYTKAVAAVTVSRETLNDAQSKVSTQESVRRDKFGNGVVSDAQREAEAILKRLREDVVNAQTTCDATRHQNTTATQERLRLHAAITERTKEYQALSERLRKAAATAGFTSDQDLRGALLPATEAKIHAELRDRLQTSGVTLATQAADLAKRRTALPPSAGIDAPNLQALRSEHTARTEESGTLQSSLGGVRATLKNDDDQRARQATFADQIEAAHREYVRWDKLRVLIGSADGSLFARFAQGLTLERLTVLANRHLRQLNPRYSIRRAADDGADDLELEIVDHYQADAPRPMQSLSGGESFLASLALALGLSELASGNTRIDSLFIDEGFGSLDGDTLEVAMSALENLQSTGKTIGVISHVPAMQERIPTQIKVVKATGGCSHIITS